MAKSSRNQERLLPRCYQVGNVSVPEAVEGDSLHVTPGHTTVEHLGDTLRVEWRAVQVGKRRVLSPDTQNPS
jgi:hypothetical protein